MIHKEQFHTLSAAPFGSTISIREFHDYDQRRGHNEKEHQDYFNVSRNNFPTAERKTWETVSIASAGNSALLQS
jgi:hypothetical protein